MTDRPFQDFSTRLRELIRISGDRAGDAQAFEELAMELFELQSRHNPAYGRMCAARGIKPANWFQVPAVPTSAFKELELTSLATEDRTTVFHSSGTTEQRPSSHFHSAESLRIYEEAALAGIPSFLFPAAGTQQQLLILTPPRRQAPHSSLVHMFHIFRRAFGSAQSEFLGAVTADGAWQLDFEAAETALGEASAADRPVVLLGTAFSFVHLLDHFLSKRLQFQLPSGSRALETGGYKGRSRSLPKQELYASIEERLGIPQSKIICEYGMSELSSQAYDSPGSGNRRFRFPAWARAVVISPETGLEVAEGETGLLRVFDLANVFSVMAIQTEDLAVRHANAFELLGRAHLAEARGCSLMPA